MLQLRFRVEGEERSLPLTSPETYFGRSGENEVVLPDYSVSRRHAVVRREGEQWFVFDLKSTNGVQVNQVGVERAPLRAGDLLKIGVFEIRIEDTGAARPEEPNAPSRPDLVPIQEGPTRTGSPPPGSGPPRGSQLRQTRPRSVVASSSPSPPLGHFAAPAAGGPANAGPPSVPPPPAFEPPRSGSKEIPSGAISNATIIRPLSDLSTSFLAGDADPDSPTATRQSKREALDQAYSSHVFGFLIRLGQLLITTSSDDQILQHVMDIAFDALPVDRGFILLRNEKTGATVCELVRRNDQVELRPKGEVPISKTMLEEVMRERVALLTFDALSDQRLAGTESVRIHQIRAAMCTPLWSGEKIIGVMQLDTPHHTGSFTEQDVDLLATLANYCAVAIERNRNARDAEFQRGVRNRLERYHSPAVIEQVLQEDPADEGVRGLKQAEVSVLFADIVGFTAFSENSEPEEVAALMKGFFTHAVEAIFSTGGTLDKFIGDCVMAFFGAPMQQEDHAYRAVLAAVRIREALDDWNDERRREDLPQVRIRIGINTGPVVVGDIGSNRRVDYTVLGNTVNVAARLEEAAAGPGEIVIGEETYRQLAGRIPAVTMGDLQLKGLSQRTAVYRVERQ